MKGLLLGTLVFYFTSVALAEDAVCDVENPTDLTVVIKDGDSFKYKTSSSKKYGKNMECKVSYELDQSCAEMELRCKKIVIKGNKDCSKGDKLMITNAEGTETVCGKKKKFVFQSSSNMVLEFTSDKKNSGPGAKGCVVKCSKAATATTAPSPAPVTTAPAPATTAPPAPTTTPGGSTLPNPGGSAEELTLEIQQTWAQEPAGYTRTAKVAIPATTAGQKIPVVIHLHGNGGNGNTKPFGNFLGDDCVIVAPDGYQSSWNVYSEKSKADDVQFILDLIAKIGAEIPAADMNDVNIAGTSNGAALTYLLLISTGSDRPFRRAFPMVSSLIGPQYHDDQFWTFSESAAEGEANDFNQVMVPTFSDSFEYAHFHGTEDGLIKYEGQNPGPALLKNAEVIAAQLTDYIWAKAMGFTGPQIPDSDGVDLGDQAKPAQEYKYLDGRCRHYKLIGEGHGTGPTHPVVQEAMREMILG